MMAPPADSVTLLVVSYKQERFIEEALRAALAQTYQPLEILVSDDASPDGTFAVIERVLADYRGPHRVRTNRNPANLGLIGHVHRCVELIDTEWVIAAAGDDISEPHRVARIMEAIRRRPSVDAVFSGFRYIDESGAGANPIWRPRLLTRSAFRPPVHSTQRGRVLGFLVNDDGYVLGAAAAWRRRLFTEFPRVNPDCTEDSVVGFRAALGGGVCEMPEALVQYRRHDANIWSVSANHAAVDREQLHARRWRLQQGVLNQWEQDLEHARSMGKISSDLAEEVRLALLARRAMVGLWMSSDNGNPKVVASLAAHAALIAREQAGSRLVPWHRLDDWLRRKARRGLAAITRRYLSLE